MISRRTKIIIIGLIVTLVLTLVVVVNFSFKGTPWGKADFTKKTEQYLSLVNYNIPNEYELSTIHSFKTGQYTSIIKIPNGIQFYVTEDYDNNLIDNYYVAKIEHTVTNEGMEVIKDLFGDSAKINLHIEEMGISEKLTENSSYGNLGRDIKVHATFHINLKNKFTNDEVLIEKCSNLLNWIRTKSYNSNVYISFDDGHVISINYDELLVMKKGDILKYAYKLQK